MRPRGSRWQHGSYLATDRSEAAEPYLQRAADRPVQTLKSSLTLADYDGSLGRYDDAKAALSRIARAESADGAAAQVRLAALEYAAGSRDEGRQLPARVIKRPLRSAIRHCRA